MALYLILWVKLYASLKFAADQFSQPLTDADAKSIIGLGLPEVAQRLFPTVPELHSEILQSYADHYVAHSKGDMWFEGVADMFQELRDAGLQLAVATGKVVKV